MTSCHRCAGIWTAKDLTRVRISATDKVAFQATRLNPDNPWVHFVASSLERSTQSPPHILPNLAGSLPNNCFSDILNLPTIWIPHSYRGCAQHAPNEHMPIALLHQAFLAMVGLYWDLGETERTARCTPPHWGCKNRLFMGSKAGGQIRSDGIYAH